MPTPSERSVFINCPFDHDYRPLFDALVFVVIDCGFEPRCAKEASDSGQVRIEKILGIIRDCQFGIHDISRTELDKKSRLPRFNMPLELGLGGSMIPSGSTIARRYGAFRADLPLYCGTFQQREDEPTFGEFKNLIKIWLDDENSP